MLFFSIFSVLYLMIKMEICYKCFPLGSLYVLSTFFRFISVYVCVRVCVDTCTVCGRTQVSLLKTDKTVSVF